MTTETVTTDPNPPVDPAVAAAAAAAALPVDPPAATEPPAGETPPAAAVTDPQAPPEAVERPHGNKGRKPWYLDRISEETQARQQAEERARNAEALLERSAQTRSPPDPAAPVTPRADDSAVETRARQIAQETLNGEKIRGVIQSGLAKFADWDDRAATLGAAGAATPDFVLDVVSVDPTNAHLILHQLADDPQKAARLAKMDTRTRTIELVKMSMAASPTAATETPPAKAPVPPKTVSRAPPPPPPVEPSASQVVDWRSDKASDAEFSRGWEENARKRSMRK
jgi:hypothetical protein